MLIEGVFREIKAKNPSLILTPLPQLKEEINARWDRPVLGMPCYTVREIARAGKRVLSERDAVLLLGKELGNLGDAEYSYSIIVPAWLGLGSLEKALRALKENPRRELLERAGKILLGLDFDYSLLERKWENPGYVRTEKILLIGEEFIDALDRNFLSENFGGSIERISLESVLPEKGKILPVKCFGRSQALSAAIELVRKFGPDNCAIIQDSGKYPELERLFSARGIPVKAQPIRLIQTKEFGKFISLGKAILGKTVGRETLAFLSAEGLLGNETGGNFSRGLYLEEGELGEKAREFLSDAREKGKTLGSLAEFAGENLEGDFSILLDFLGRAGLSEEPVSRKSLNSTLSALIFVKPSLPREKVTGGVVLSEPENASGIGRPVQILLGIDSSWLEERLGLEEAKLAGETGLGKGRERKREATFSALFRQGNLCYPILVERAGKDHVFASARLFSEIGLSVSDKEKPYYVPKNSDLPEELATRHGKTLSFPGEKSKFSGKLLLENPAGKKLSSSTLDLFCQCRRKYYYSKVLGLSYSAEASEFGSLVHSHIERLFSERAKHIDRAEKALKDEKEHERILLSLVPKERKGVVLAKIGRFREISERIVNNFGDGWESEKWLESADKKFRGKIDYLNGNVAVDFKTGRNVDAKGKLGKLPFARFDPKDLKRGKRKFEAQTASYCYLLSENGEKMPKIRFVFLKEFDCPSPDPERLETSISPEIFEYSEENFLSLFCQKGGRGKFYSNELGRARAILTEIPDKEEIFKRTLESGSSFFGEGRDFRKEVRELFLNALPGEDPSFHSKCSESARAFLSGKLLFGDLESFREMVEYVLSEIKDAGFFRTPFSKASCSECAFVDLCGNLGYFSENSEEEGAGEGQE